MSDRISDLPWDILDNILGHLPIKDAVRTSILSRKWRYKWVDLSKVVVDNRCGVPYFEDTDNDWLNWDHLAKVVYKVLLAHRGQIDKFVLSTQCVVHSSDLDCWIAFLCRNGVKELILDSNRGIEYKLPSCLFSCQQLSCLRLTKCSFVTPLELNGFSNLVSLQMESCIVQKEVLENLISSCPILETLKLFCSCDFDHLNIRAPNLKSLCISSNFMSIYLENCVHLTELCLYMSGNFNMPLDTVPLLGFVSHLERLDLYGHLLNGFPVACDNLKFLELSEIYFGDLDAISVFLSLLGRSSSNLKALCISAIGVFQQDVYELMTAQNQLSYCFNQLQTVKISVRCHEEDDIRCWKSELELIRLVLARSPVLEKMLVEYKDQEDCDRWLMRELLSFERASAKLLFQYSSIPRPFYPDEW
ncbi:unnamed protein product [Ilex paraguariensis]|uniref:F-box domain-containing protein n=1 Tax=Ilex paraguariensis TaxID=185542 RepID=A0ABC8RDF4_9AQUA